MLALYFKNTYFKNNLKAMLFIPLFFCWWWWLFFVLFCFSFLWPAGDAIQNHSALFLENSSLNITLAQESPESPNTSNQPQGKERKLSLASTNSENSGSTESLPSAYFTNSEWSLVTCAVWYSKCAFPISFLWKTSLWKGK